MYQLNLIRFLFVFKYFQIQLLNHLKTKFYLKNMTQYIYLNLMGRMYKHANPFFFLNAIDGIAVYLREKATTYETNNIARMK